MSSAATVDETFDVLLVCTGNICRSAFAERLGHAFLLGQFGVDHERVRLISAGTRAVIGSGMDPASALVLRGLGGDPDGFSAHQLGPHEVAGADLVLTMTREHRREVLRIAPRALARTFVLREAADLITGVDEAEVAESDLVARARGLVRALAAARARRRTDERDDVPDPIGRPLRVHQDVGDVIAGSLIPLLARLVGASGRAPAGEPWARPPTWA